MVLVTGASGFIARALIARLSAHSDVHTVGASRKPLISNDENVSYFRCDDSIEIQNWDEALRGVQVVVHTAARVHVMNDHAFNPMVDFERINVTATMHLATQSAAAGVKRFVFISSIKVNGEWTEHGRRFSAEDTPAPSDPYSLSKYKAELSLLALAKKTDMEVVIIRPPLVYGANVKANFAVMMRWLQNGIPLPFGAIHNQRSLVAVENLVELIITCCTHSHAANQVFLVSDDFDVSTTELLRKLGEAMGRKVWLVPVPMEWLRRIAVAFGREQHANRLLSSLQVDISKTRELLGWRPVVTLDQGLRSTVESLE